MIELIFAACLLAAPDQCTTKALSFSTDDVSVVSCQMGIGGQLQLVEWAKAHPGYFVGRHKCRVAGKWANI